MTDSDKHFDINAAISSAVLYLMETSTPKKLTQNAVSKLAGIPQTTLSYGLLKGWTLDTLDKVSTALGTTIEEVIALGRTLATNDGKPVFPRPLKLAEYPPASDARLAVIVKQAAGVTTAFATLLNSQSIQDAMPGDYGRYRAGEISDGEMFQLLRKRLASVERDCKFLSAADDLSAGLLFGE